MVHNLHNWSTVDWSGSVCIGGVENKGNGQKSCWWWCDLLHMWVEVL